MYLLPSIENESLSFSLALVKTFNLNQIQSLRGEIFGTTYWYKKKARFNQLTRKRFAFLQKVDRYAKKRISKGYAKPELSLLGSELVREFTHLNAYNYATQFLTSSNWRIFFTEDEHLQYWINETRMQIVMYCEGDIVTYTATSSHMLYSELLSIKKWHVDNN